MKCLNCEEGENEVGGLCTSCHREMVEDVHREARDDGRTVEDINRANGSSP